MNPLPMIRPAYLGALVCILAAFIGGRGLLPAIRFVDSDFPNYYVASKEVLAGSDPARLYDDGWFQQRIYAAGILQRGKFSPFPPATVFIMEPLAGLSPIAALRIVTALNVLMLIAATALLARRCPFTLLESAAFVLLSGQGLANCFRLGQLYIAVSLLVILGFVLLERGHEFWAGAALALPVPFKYFPAIYLACLGAKRKWRPLVSACAVIATIVAVSIAALGWRVHMEFFHSVLPRHLRSDLSLQDPFAVAFQSFDSLLRRLFVLDAVRNPHPLADAAGIYPVVKAGIMLILAGVLVQGIRWAELRGGGSVSRLSIAMAGIWGLLIAPATATYHFVLLWLPVGLLLAHLREAGREKLFWMSLSSYAAIGFLPYRLFEPLAGRGVLAFAAYPRLWCMLTLFLAAVHSARHANASGKAPEPQIHADERG